MQYHAIQCNTMQYPAIPCNTMQHQVVVVVIVVVVVDIVVVVVAVVVVVVVVVVVFLVVVVVVIVVVVVFVVVILAVVVVLVVVVVVVFVVVFFFPTRTRAIKIAMVVINAVGPHDRCLSICSVRRQPRVPDTIMPLALLQLDLCTMSSVLSNNDNQPTARNAILDKKIAFFLPAVF